MTRAIVIVAALATAAGCALFEDRPDRSCKVSSDCLQAQGESCDPTSKTCVTRPDAQLVSTPVIDAMVDAMVDSGAMP